MEQSLSRRTSNKKQVYGLAWSKAQACVFRHCPARGQRQRRPPGRRSPGRGQRSGSELRAPSGHSLFGLGAVTVAGALLTRCEFSQWMDSKSSKHGAGPPGSRLPRPPRGWCRWAADPTAETGFAESEHVLGLELDAWPIPGHGAVGPSGQPRALVSAGFPRGLPALAGAACGERGHGQL